MRTRSLTPLLRQRGGIAIFFALLIVALTASVAAAISYDMVLDTRRTQSLLYLEQARLVAYGAEDWIGDVLRQDRLDNQDDHLGELWAQELPALPVEGVGIQGVITGNIQDLQSRLNLNNLVDASDQPVADEIDRFERLLTVLGIDNPALSDALIDWMDADSNIQFPGGAEDDIYSARTPALQTANQPFRSVGELALVEGFTKDIVDALRPHVCALPSRTQINANTATPAVLQSLDANISASDVEQIVLDRESGIADLDVAFGSLLPPNTIETLTLETEYFQLRSVVRIGSVRFTLYSLVHRTSQGDISLVMRSFGSEY